MKGEIEAFLRGMNVPEARYTAEKHDPTFHPGRCAASAWAASTSAASARSIRSWPAATALTARFSPRAELHGPAVPAAAGEDLYAAAKVPGRHPRHRRRLRRGRNGRPPCPTASAPQAASCCAAWSCSISTAARASLPARRARPFRLTLRADDRTLTDADSDGVVSAVLAALEKELNAKLR